MTHTAKLNMKTLCVVDTSNGETEWPSCNLMSFSKWLENKLSEIPEEYMGKAYFAGESGNLLKLKIRYMEEENHNSINKDQALIEMISNRERELFELLRIRYENMQSST